MHQSKLQAGATPGFMKAKTIRAGAILGDRLSSPAFHFKDGEIGPKERKWRLGPKSSGPDSKLLGHTTLFLRLRLRDGVAKESGGKESKYKVPTSKEPNCV